MTTFPKAVEIPVFSRDLAKAIYFQVSQDILTSVPLLDDYLCPICFNIVWRPVKLRCQHVFCIRCLIVMQRDRNDHCPLCREKVVMEANKGEQLQSRKCSKMESHAPVPTANSSIQNTWTTIWQSIWESGSLTRSRLSRKRTNSWQEWMSTGRRIKQSALSCDENFRINTLDY